MRVDFDGDGIQLLRGLYDASGRQQDALNRQYERDWLQWNAIVDMTNRDPDLPHIALPKIYSVVEGGTPRDTKALLGMRPYLSWESKRKEFRDTAKCQVEMLDELLEKGGFFEEMALALKLKRLYGTSFISFSPYFEKVTERYWEDTPMGPVKREVEAHRLRIRVECWAPWEVKIDPAATGLNAPWKCRWAIKVQLASKRMIMQHYERGGYPDMDVQRLLDYSGSSTRYRAEHWGLQMISQIGLTAPEDDDDLGLLMKIEMPDRYVDIWQGEVLLKDGPNPFNHGMINLTRFIHIMQPHTQHRFWGMGEAKPLEVQAAMLNDIYNLAFQAYGLLMQPVIFHRKGAIKNSQSVYGFGNRIPIKSDDPSRPISHDFVVDPGQGLPKDHYMMAHTVERNMDLTSGQFEPQRGELGNKDNTATEVAILKESGDYRTELQVALAERMSMADLAVKGSSIIEQFGNINDAIEILGEERAMIMDHASPMDLPGGHNWTFKGSARIVNLLIKQRNFKELLPDIMSFPNVKPVGVSRKLMETFEFDDAEFREMFMDENEMAMMQAQQAAQASMDMENQAALGHLNQNQAAPKGAPTDTAGDQASPVRPTGAKKTVQKQAAEIRQKATQKAYV